MKNRDTLHKIMRKRHVVNAQCRNLVGILVDRHIFICGSETSTGDSGGSEILRKFRGQVDRTFLSSVSVAKPFTPGTCLRLPLRGVFTDSDVWYPTEPFTILKHQNPSQDALELQQIIHRSPDLKSLKLWKVQSGRWCFLLLRTSRPTPLQFQNPKNPSIHISKLHTIRRS